jgi:hypothetical protein
MAVPAAVSCDVPNKWMSVQLLAEASQKFTWPTVTAAVPAFTVAVRVTTVPAATVVTAPVPEVTASVVAVGGAAAETVWHVALTAAMSARYRNARAHFVGCRRNDRCLGQGSATQGRFIAGQRLQCHREPTLFGLLETRDVIPRGRDRPQPLQIFAECGKSLPHGCGHQKMTSGSFVADPADTLGTWDSG